MRKFGVKLFILVLMMMTSLALVLNVRAVEDDYVDFDSTSSPTTQTTETQKTTEETKPAETPKTTEETKTTETPKTTEETKTTDKSTTAHVQAGVFENSFFVVATILLALSIGFGYRKLKQYNF